MKRTREHSLISVIGASLIVLILLTCKHQNQAQGQQSQSQHQEAQQSKLDVTALFVASGWMGDGEQGTKYIQLSEAWRKNPHSTPTCIKVVYSPGPNGFAGIYWQNKPNNWGDKPGENYSQAGYRKLTFWARGESGGEVVEFKAGGIDTPGKPYKDSFEVTTGKISLDSNWHSYTIDLENADLSSVIGGFCWVAARSASPKGLTFYIDDVYYER
jgi:hypothetical protein